MYLTVKLLLHSESPMKKMARNGALPTLYRKAFYFQPAFPEFLPLSLSLSLSLSLLFSRYLYLRRYYTSYLIRLFSQTITSYVPTLPTTRCITHVIHHIYVSRTRYLRSIRLCNSTNYTLMNRLTNGGENF